MRRRSAADPPARATGSAAPGSPSGPDRASDADLARRWARRHPGFGAADATRGLVRPWLRLMWSLARPLAVLRVPPDAVTAAGVLTSVAAVRARPGPAGGWLLAGALADGLDGAVAVLTDRPSVHGATVDHVADRVADLAAAFVLARAGAPWPLLAPGLAATFGLELTRGRWLPVVTAGERPTRVVCGVIGAWSVAVTGRRWPAGAAALVWAALGLVALGQLAAARHTRRP